MGAQCQADMAIVLDHFAPRLHRAQLDGRLVDLQYSPRLARSRGGEQRQRLVAQRLDRPHRITPRKTEGRTKGVGVGKVNERCGRHGGTAPQIVDGRKRPITAGGDDLRRIAIGEAAHHAHAEPDRKAVLVLGRLQRAVPSGSVDVDGPHLDAVIARIAHDLRRRVKSHRLRIQ